MLWLKGECSAEEQEYWDSWQEDPDNNRLAREAEQIISALNKEYDIPDARAELQKLENAIDTSEQQASSAQQERLNRFSKKALWPVAAGILLLIAALAGLFAYQNYPAPVEKQQAEAPRETPVKEYKTDYGEKLTFRLSDGSSIVLNANSHLEFSSKIEQGLNTEVWLEGEAYFNITPLEGDRQRTFTVHTENGSVQVLGTRFAVNTFRDHTQTVLEEGRIKVQVKKEAENQQVEYLLEPDEMVRFKAFDNKITVREVNTQIYTSWTGDKLIFDNTPLREVASRIEDTFGVRVEVNDRLSGKRLSGSIKSDNLEVLSQALQEILDTTVDHENRVLRIGIGTQ